MRLSPSSFLAFVALLLMNCSAPSADELLEKAQAAHKSGNYKEALEFYETILDRYPSGKYKSSTLFLLGSLYNNELKDYRAAIRYYRDFADSYPEAENAPLALFLIGFIYNNELQEFDSARTAYVSFLSRYPEHEMAVSAQFELEHLGEDAEKMLHTEKPEEEEPGH
ncbi:MAG: tetratricopeptide repeat protein [Bacteroidota bacterium]